MNQWCDSADHPRAYCKGRWQVFLNDDNGNIRTYQGWNEQYDGEIAYSTIRHIGTWTHYAIVTDGVDNTGLFACLLAFAYSYWIGLGGSS